MDIDKISWRTYDTRFQKFVPVSLPRVKWLERDPDWRPPVYVEPPKEEPVQPPAVQNPHRHTFRPQLRSNELSVTERQAWNLRLAGMSHAEVGERMGKSANAASKLIGRAREKLGIGLE